MIYWWCHRPNCKVTMSTKLYDETIEHPNITVRNEPALHYHPDDTTLINKEDFKKRAVKKITEDTGRTAISAYTSVSTSVAQGGEEAMLPAFPPLTQ